MKLEADLYYKEDSYFVVVDAIGVVGKPGRYIVHAEGVPKTLFKVYKEHKEEITPSDKTTYFMVKSLKYFKNHSEPVKGIEGLFKWKEK